MNKFFFVILLTCMILGSSAGVYAADINGLRFGQHPDKTRVVLELGTKTPYKIFTLKNPHRVVIDVENGKWNAKSIYLGNKSGIINKVRHSQHNSKTHRIVLHTRTNLSHIKDFALSKGSNKNHRVVFDLFHSNLPQAPITATPKKVTPAPKLDNRIITYRKAPVIPNAYQVVAVIPKGRKPIIVIDPGHGGKDPGAIGASGLKEKDIVLRMSKELKAALDRTGRYRTYLTRSDDRFIRLRNRIKIAHDKQADLFISVHADAHKNRKAVGASVYTLSETASDAEAAALAARENKADLIGGVDLRGESEEVSSILIDLVQRETMNLSAKFAKILSGELSKKIKTKKEAHRFAGFVVLKAPDTPAALVELGYMSNPKEEWQLQQRSYRAKIASAVVKGVNNYFSWKTANK